MAAKVVTPEVVRRSTRQTVMTEKNMQEESKRLEEEIKKLFKQPIAETHQDDLIKTSKSLKLYLAQYQKISRDLVKNLKVAASITEAQEVAENRRDLKEDVNEHLDLINEELKKWGLDLVSLAESIATVSTVDDRLHHFLDDVEKQNSEDKNEEDDLNENGAKEDKKTRREDRRQDLCRIHVNSYGFFCCASKNQVARDRRR